LETGATVHLGYYTQSGLVFDESQKVIEIIKEIAEVIEVGKNRTLSAAQFLEYFLFPRDMHYNEVARLSGGEKRRLYLMTILMKNPNFLILDEPTNDLDIMTLNVLEDYLSDFGGTILIVSHDRYFTDKVADTLFVFEGNGEISHFPGNYSQYIEEKNEREKIEAKQVTESKIVKEKPKQTYQNRLSYKEKLEFSSLEKEIHDLGIEKKQIEHDLSFGNFSAEEYSQKSLRYNKITETLDEKEFRWLELSEKE
jgi:ATP-binding cassette subfamily F protein uup